jgi:NADH-quinone oxidoreductase subunit H
MQTRLGPTRVGPAGLLQPLADALKLLQKERLRPNVARPGLFHLAPALAAFLALATVAVVPLGPGLAAVPVRLGLLYLLALGALSVIPVWMAGWASNSKYALLGAMRAVAQTVSYEVPMLMAALVPVTLAGSFDLDAIVRYQQGLHWFAYWPPLPGLPAMLLFLIALLAESNRIPFDIPEAESELVAGIMTEYSGVALSLLMVAEYLHTLVGSAVAATLFLGGWDGPFLPGWMWMLGKTLGIFVVLYVVRWTLLRWRSDQLMALCWKYLVPAGLGLVVMAAVWVRLFSGRVGP